MKKRVKGFTLIEMLIVVVIIGILSAIIVPRMSGQSLKARVTSCAAQISSINSVMELVAFDENARPWQYNGLIPRDEVDWTLCETTWGTLDSGLLLSLDNTDADARENHGVMASVLRAFFPDGGMMCPVDGRNRRGYVVFEGRVSSNYELNDLAGWNLDETNIDRGFAADPLFQYMVAGDPDGAGEAWEGDHKHFSVLPYEMVNSVHFNQ